MIDPGVAATARRYLWAAVTAAAVTFSVFLLMHRLVDTDAGRADEAIASLAVDFVRVKKESDLELKKRKLPDKAPPEEPPEAPEEPPRPEVRPDHELDDIAPMGPSLDLAGGPYLGAPSDTDIIPLVRVNPQYPIRAMERGIEGWVHVRFTITTAGTVKDIEVIGHEPSSIFDRAALRAIRKWKYKPQIVDGMAEERPGVMVRLTFELEDAEQ